MLPRLARERLHERARAGVARGEAGGHVGDAAPQGGHRCPRELLAGAGRAFGVVAEERATPEGPGRVHAAAPVRGQQRARPELDHRQPAGVRSGRGSGLSRLQDLFELCRGRVGLAARDREVATLGLRGATDARPRAGAGPALEQRVHLRVEGAQLGAVQRARPSRVGASHRGGASYSTSRMDAHSRPTIRAVESIVVPDREHGRVLVLRDTQGVTDAHAVIPPVLVPVVSRFTGRKTCEEIAREASLELGADVPVAAVVELATQLERGLFLDGAPFREARARVVQTFAEAAVRPATHAGGAYHREPGKLRRYIEESCLAAANGAPVAASRAGTMVALVAPHIDPWRGAVGYGHAYGALGAALPAEADTFVLFGTSHAPMREPFALCRKAFATPLGDVEADLEAIDALAARADGFDPYADQFNHKREHSLEFQAVFLKHLRGDRPLRIVPVLAGLGAQQQTGEDPDRDVRVARFLDGVRALVEERPGRVVVVAGADMAHVGPRFGDAAAYDEDERAALEGADRASLERAAAVDAPAFWADVSRDLDERRVCGLAPIWSLLRSVTPAARGEVLHYEQTVDADDGSIVSHAAMGFYAP